MSEFVTAKDELANLIETGLTDLGVCTAEIGQDAAILLVQKMETAGLLPVDREYTVGDESGNHEQTYLEPPVLGEGQYLLQRLCTPWMGQSR